MKSDEIIILNNNKKVKGNIIKNSIIQIRKIFYLLIIIILSLLFQKTNFKNNFYKKKAIFPIIQNENYSITNNCSIVKEQLDKRTQPFNYENEFYFFTSIISCKIPFSFIRFADGEEYIILLIFFRF